MPACPRKIPSYCRHHASGQAYVTIGGRENYLGVYGFSESHQKYARLIAENFPSRNDHRVVAPSSGDITINELLLRYWTDFVEGYHQKNGKPTERQSHIKRSLRHLQRLYGNEPARSFGPKSLQVVRNAMIKDGVKRRGRINRMYVNDMIEIIKRMFQWAVCALATLTARARLGCTSPRATRWTKRTLRR